jgi:hypothetical protein
MRLWRVGGSPRSPDTTDQEATLLRQIPVDPLALLAAARVVAYLAGLGGDCITGQFLLIDGGNILYNPRPRTW